MEAKDESAAYNLRLDGSRGGEIRWQGGTFARSLRNISQHHLYRTQHRSQEELTSLENLRISSGLAGIEVSRKEAYSVLGKMVLLAEKTWRQGFV